jgi:hypothetical protein
MKGPDGARDNGVTQFIAKETDYFVGLHLLAMTRKKMQIATVGPPSQ